MDTWQLVDGDVTVVDGLVLRPAWPWTPTVHALLRHLRAQGLACVPEPVDVRDGIEGLLLLDGDAGTDAWRHQLTDHAVRSAGALLRRIHDATEGFVPPDDAGWAFPPVPGATLVTHGDPGPWNFVWRDGEAVGLIDWDYAAPAPAIDDVAYAVEMFAPFRSDEEAREMHGFTTPPDRRARIRAFAGGYGWEATDGLVDRVVERQEATVRRIADLAGGGHEPWASWVRAGHLDEVKARPRWTRQHRHLIG